MTDILQERLKASPDAFASAVGDETVLLQVKRGAYFGLDAMGTRIWSGVNAGQSAPEICEQIAAEFDVPIETVESDARTFLEELKANEIIVAD
jgi:hypothetical protein